MWNEYDKAAIGSYAQAVMERITTELPSDLGVTIIIHDESLTPNLSIALYTTLPSRSHARVLLTETIFAQVIADGGTPDSVADMCAADAAAVFGGSAADAS